MKTKLFLLILGCSISCKSIQTHIQNDTLCDFDMTLYDDERVIDIKGYDSLFKKSDHAVMVDNKYLLQEVSKYENREIIQWKYNKTSKINKINKYYKNGRIKYLKFKYRKGGEYIGTETHYDIEGNITEVIDHRDAVHYPICFKEALAIVKTKLKKGFEISSIRRKQKTEKEEVLYYWTILAKRFGTGDDSSIETIYYDLDATTGKILRKGQVFHNDGF